VDNLSMVGRNVSISRAALGTARVMATTGLMGQGVGTAAALALRQGLTLPEFSANSASVETMKQALLRDGCFLLNTPNRDPLDLARAARATASSEASFALIGPESPAYHGDLIGWQHGAYGGDDSRIATYRGQWIAAGTSRFECIRLCLTNPTAQIQKLSVRLMPTEHIWDYRTDTGTPIVSATIDVPPGEAQWIEWPCRADVTPGRYYRIDAAPNPELHWLIASTFEPGHVAAAEMSPGKMRRFKVGTTLSVAVSPPQPCYGAANVLSGVTRPQHFTNLWRSDPALPLPQWLQLAWETPQTLAHVELTFPGHLVREYHAYGPFFRDPQCPKDYRVEALINGRWETIITVAGNYHRHRRHALAQPVTTNQLRVVITATNGDPCAAIYEVRGYA
jgi:hypothetical protein